MAPDASRHNPDPEYLRSLIKAAGVSQEKAAAMIGISGRMMRHYLSEAGKYPAPYSIQYALEGVARYGRG